MNKIDSLLKQNSKIKDFHVFDTDAEWDTFLGNVENEQNKESTDENKNRPMHKSFMLVIRSIAAILVIVFVFFLALKQPEKSRTILFANENQKLELKDGSTIELVKGSEVDYPVHFKGANERKVILNGTATFDIRKSILPFVVYSGDIKTEVIGTKFILSVKSDTSWIENIEGTVKVSVISNPAQVVILNAGDKFKYAGGKFINMVKPESATEVKQVVHKSTQHHETNPPKISIPEKSEKEPAKEIGSVYKLGSVLKEYLVKQNKKTIRIDKKFKYDPELRIRLDINKNYMDIIEALKSQGIIDTKTGDCPECIIIIAPGSQK